MKHFKIFGFPYRLLAVVSSLLLLMSGPLLGDSAHAQGFLPLSVNPALSEASEAVDALAGLVHTKEPRDLNTPELIRLNKKAKELTQKWVASCGGIGREKYKVTSSNVAELIKEANRHGYHVVSYVDFNYYGLFHEDIYELRLRTPKEELTEEGQPIMVAPVQFNTQYGLSPEIFFKDSRKDYVKMENESLNNRSSAPNIDAVVVVSPTKLRQLEQMRDYEAANSWKPFFARICWSTAETTWNQWLPTPIQYDTGGMCEEVHRIGGDPGALRTLCTKKFCQLSSPRLKSCVVENKIEIDSCYNRFESCLRAKPALKPAWQQYPQ